jgi:hypothetical protein
MLLMLFLLLSFGYVVVFLVYAHGKVGADTLIGLYFGCQIGYITVFFHSNFGVFDVIEVLVANMPVERPRKMHFDSMHTKSS